MHVPELEHAPDGIVEPTVNITQTGNRNTSHLHLVAVIVILHTLV